VLGIVARGEQKTKKVVDGTKKRKNVADRMKKRKIVGRTQQAARRAAVSKAKA